jgi:prevent-host-death family protein
VDEAISAADANREFSRLLREVRQGRSFVVTSHGKPVARIAPAFEASNASAKTALLDRLTKEKIIDVGRWSRDELYERKR